MTKQRRRATIETQYPYPEGGIFIGNMKNAQVLFLAIILNTLTGGVVAPHTIETGPVTDAPSMESTIQNTSIASEGRLRTIKRKMVVLTAYSSTPDQTDNTPFITAANTSVRDGIVAANFLPFHAKIMIPELFGDKIFTVEDRMHRRFSDRVDIWFSNRETAKKFGIKKIEIIILSA